jgi:hypothetical protein
MKAMIVGLSAVVSVSLMADPGTYKGKGRGRFGGPAESSYTVTLVAREIKAKSVYELEESWVTDKGDKMTVVHTFHFNPDGTLKVKRDNVEVGCGYSFEDANGMWIDYRLQSPQGPLHINQYFSKADKRVLRIGDGIFNGQVMFWTDSLDKQ